MELDRVIAQFGTHPVTLLDAVLAAVTLAFILLMAITLMVWRSSRTRRDETMDRLRRTAELEFRLAELSGLVHGFATQTQGQQQDLHRTLDERLDQVSQRIGHGLHEQSDRTTESLGALHERLAVIDAAQANLARLSTEMVSLKDILNNKQTRGAFGQGRMEAIIQDGLHSKAYAFQATLSNNTRPDCVITLPGSVLRLVIDAKFPLESYNAIKVATEPHERQGLETRLRQDILKHVKDIAEKYLISGETHETAIMFVPSESIYAELHEKFEDVIQKAHRQHIILASPNVLMLLVQTMQAIVKDAAMRDQAHLIKAEVVKLLEDVTRLQERTGDLKKHFDQASSDIEKITISSDRITKRGLRIENLDVEDEKAAVQDTPRPRLVTS
jgi:DNA recombination protein RmuC